MRRIFVTMHISTQRFLVIITFAQTDCFCFFIPNSFLRIPEMIFGLSISTTFITYLRKHNKLTTTSVTDAATSVHLAGKTVATSSPSPKNTAGFSFCLWHFTVSPFIILYRRAVCVLEFCEVLYYDILNKSKTVTI